MLKRRFGQTIMRVVFVSLIAALGVFWMAWNYFSHTPQTQDTTTSATTAHATDSQTMGREIGERMQSLNAVMMVRVSTSPAPGTGSSVYIGVDGDDIINLETKAVLGSMTPSPKFTICHQVQRTNACYDHVADSAELVNGRYEFRNMRIENHRTEILR